MPSFIERIQAKIELFRLEQRYTRRRHRRSTFVSNAVYVDGEYIFQTPISTGSSTTASNTATASRTSLPGTTTSTGNTIRNRLSMPSFSSLSKASGRPQDWRMQSTIYEGR